MSLSKLLLVGALCLATGFLTSYLVAEDDQLPDGRTQSEPFGEVKQYSADDNHLLGSSSNRKSETDKADTEADDEDVALIRDEKALIAAYSVETSLDDLRRMVFEGATQFSTDELRYALARDIKYQAAARPSASAFEFLLTLEQRLRAGYLHCGFPDATVRARFDNKSRDIVVQIDEGPRFRHGQIEVIGPADIDNDAIVRWLTTPQQPPIWTYAVNDRPLDTWRTNAQVESRGRYGEGTPTNAANTAANSAAAATDVEKVTFWEPGEIFDFGHFDDAKLNGGIQLALLQLGFTKCDFKTELKRNAKSGTVSLQIAVPENTPKLQISEIEISGLKRDSRDAVLKYLGVASGDSLTAELLQRIGEKLSASCRYWKYGVSVNIAQEPDGAAAKGKASLRLAVEEYAAAPPLDQPLSPRQETMRKCADWLKSLNSNFGERDLICTTESVALGGGLQQAQIALAFDGTLAIRGTLQSTIGVRADHTFLIGKRGLEVYDWRGKSKFVSPPGALPHFDVNVRCDHDADGEQVAATKIGYFVKSENKKTDTSDTYISFQAERVALLRLADLPGTKAKLDGGTLVIESDAMVVRIDAATGAIKSIRTATYLSTGVTTIDLKSEQGFVAKLADEAHQNADEFPNGYDAGNSWGSGLAFLLGQVQKQPAIQQKPALAIACRHAALVLHNPLVRDRIIALARDDDDSGSKDERFRIPLNIHGDKELGFYSMLCSYLPVVADEVFPRGSWPWTLCRESSFYHFSDGVVDKDDDVWAAAGGRELKRWIKKSESGPVSTWMLLKCLRGLYSDDRFSFIAAIGSKDYSNEAFLKDVHLLTRGDHGLAVACRAMAEQCGSFSEEEAEELQIYMPAEAHNALKRLVARRKAKPEEPPGDAIEAVLLEYWHDGLKDFVESELRAMSTNVARAPEVEVETK